MLLVWGPCFETQYFRCLSFVIQPTLILTYKAVQELGPGSLSTFIAMCLFLECCSFWSCSSLRSYPSQGLFIECLRDDSSAGFSLIIISHPCLLTFQFSINLFSLPKRMRAFPALFLLHKRCLHNRRSVNING